MEADRRKHNKEIKPKASLVVKECEIIGTESCLGDIKRVMQLVAWWITNGTIKVHSCSEIEGLDYRFNNLTDCHQLGLRWANFLVSADWVKNDLTRIKERDQLLAGGLWAASLFPDYFRGRYREKLYDERKALVELMVEANRQTRNGTFQDEPLGEIDWMWFQDVLGIELYGLRGDINYNFGFELAIARAESQTATMLDWINA